MKQRLGYVLLLGLATGALAVSACGDDNSSSADDSGGAAGESGSSAGTKTGGSTAGGSSNKAGTDSGGSAGSGTAGMSPEGGAGGGTGGVTDGGTGGVNDGGSGGNSAGAAGSDAGAAGAGGAGLVYACGSDDHFQKLCSAKVAMDCPDPTDCSDCVTQVTSDYEGSLVGCPACDAKVDAYYQCGIDAFESGNLAAGIQCLDQVGADLSDDCGAFFDEYFECSNYIGANGCPATWPPQ